MKRKLRMILACLVTLLFIASTTLVAFADAGGFAGGGDYGGGGGGGDYGGGGSYGGGGGFIWFGDGDSEGGFNPIILVVVIVIVFIVVANIKKSGKHGAQKPSGATPTPVSSLRPLEGLKAVDPNFSDAVIREKVANLYVQMQNAWQNKEFSPMRPYMTDTLYSQFARQLDELKKSGQTNYIDQIAVLGVDLSGWTSDNANDTLVVRVRTRIVDYTVNDSTGAVIRGSKTKELFMEYEWSLIRRKGVLTPDVEKGPTKINCANCGAPMDINQSAKCEYCGTVMTTSDYDWVISAIKGLSQRSS